MMYGKARRGVFCTDLRLSLAIAFGLARATQCAVCSASAVSEWGGDQALNSCVHNMLAPLPHPQSARNSTQKLHEKAVHLIIILF